MSQLPSYARIAANRFGLGIRPDEVVAIGNDPKIWLMAQIESDSFPTPFFTDLTPSHVTIAEQTRVNKTKDEDKQEAFRKAARKALGKEIYYRLVNGVMTPASFRERLVYFWSNHFTIASQKNFITGIAGAYEREVIRPHVLGKFEDMLLAVAQHPAMLVYLDNVRSFSPKSFAGHGNKSVGLNENLAREILELHTLGVDGGYGQDDVRSLAKLITGWSVNYQEGTFKFRHLTHDPNDIRFLGKTYRSSKGKGRLERGEEALRDLARHPSTARFIATKLARHFIADNPPKKAVEALERTFLRSRGDLRQTYETLIGLDEAWQDGLPKYKTPVELIISSARLANSDQKLTPDFLRTSLKELGGTPFTAISPAGFPDTAQELLGPDALIRRVNWAQYAVDELSFALPPANSAQLALGNTLHRNSYQTITRAGDRNTAYALLLASPEFQRR